MLNDAVDFAASNTVVEMAALHPSAETAVLKLRFGIGSTNHAVENTLSNCAEYAAVLNWVVHAAAPFLLAVWNSAVENTSSNHAVDVVF